jgi:protein tyrosine kinase modulator
MVRQRQLAIDDYLNLARRWWWVVLLSGILGLSGALGISFLLPYRYESRSLILIDQQRVPDNFVQPVFTMDINEQLATIEEQVLSRTNLQPLIDKYQLFEATQNGQTVSDQTLENTRRSVAVKPVETVMSVGKSNIPGFYISFSYSDPRIAQEVCQELTSMFIDQDLQFRLRATEGTTSFLQSQLDDAKSELNQQEANLAAFERKYMGELPDDTASNLNVLKSLDARLDSVMAALDRTQQNKVYIESLLQQQLQNWQSQTATGAAQPQTLEQQLDHIQAQLVDIESRDTPEHPDVIRMKAAIASLKEKIAQAGAKPKTSPSKKSGPSVGQAPPSIQQLRSQLDVYNLAIQADTKQQQRISDQIKAYEAKIQMTPEVEAQYKEISRNHAMALKFYNSLLQKRNESRMAAALQSRQEGAEFRVLDPPSLPQKPSSPNRPLILLQGLAGGLALGVVIVWLLEIKRDETIRTEDDVQSLLHLPTLTMVPDIGEGRELKSSKRGKGKKGEGGVVPGAVA